MSASKIEWTERSDWNPLRGCTRLSEGCRHCYAERIAARFSDEGQAFHGFAKRSADGGRWTGKVELIENRLTLPLKWRKPALVFASSTSDFFHESLSDHDIDRLFAVMALAPHLTFQVLTKRAERMRAWFDRFERDRDWIGNQLDLMDEIGMAVGDRRGSSAFDCWPLPNVWLGVSVEDQSTADERIPHLLATPAARRFLSCEPLIGPVDLENVDYYPFLRACTGDTALGQDEYSPRLEYDVLRGHLKGPDDVGLAKIDWVIAGGESGRGARPMHPDWVRELRDQCASAGVPFFFKQWGEWAPGEIAGDYLNPDRAAKGASYFDGAWDECWSEPDGHCDDEPDVYRIGKVRAGRRLDGVEHGEMPA